MNCLNKIHSLYFALLGLVALACASLVHAGDKAESPVSESAPPVYNPPLRGAPRTRVGGGTRGADSAMVLSVLAPEHTGLTTHRQPDLYWYYSGPEISLMEFTLIDNASIEPLLEQQLRPQVTEKIHSLSLAEHGVSLRPGVHYQWFVTAMLDNRRSDNLLAGGGIRRITASRKLLERLDESEQAALPVIYSDQGLWYDAIMALSAQIEEAPENEELRTWRASLLEQVGLFNAAAYDRSEFSGKTSGH